MPVFSLNGASHFHIAVVRNSTPAGRLLASFDRLHYSRFNRTRTHRRLAFVYRRPLVHNSNPAGRLPASFDLMHYSHFNRTHTHCKLVFLDHRILSHLFFYLSQISFASSAGAQELSPWQSVFALALRQQLHSLACLIFVFHWLF